METLINQIMDWLYQAHGEKGELRIGIWSESDTPHTYYATVYAESYEIAVGAYGCDTISDALESLLAEVDA